MSMVSPQPLWLGMLPVAALTSSRSEPLNRSAQGSQCVRTREMFAPLISTPRPVQHGGIRLRRRVEKCPLLVSPPVLRLLLLARL